MSFYHFFTNFLEPFCLLLYFIALQFYYRKNKSKAVKQLWIYYLVIMLLQLYASLEVMFLSIGNIWVYDTVAALTMVFLSNYFYRLLQSPTKKRIVVGLLSVYVSYVIYRQITLEGRRLFDSIGYSILSASVAVYVFMYFQQMLQNVTNVSILKDINFWLAAGYLVYFVGSFIIFVSYYYFTTKVIQTLTKEERAILTALWGLHNALLFISALSFLIGSLWVTYRKKLELS